MMRHAAPRPVFVDRTGRRRRLVLLSGVGLATVLVSGLVVMAIGLSAGSGWQVPGFPDANGAINESDVGPTPTPTPAVEPEAVAEPAPSAGGTVGTAEPTSPRRVPTQTPSHPPKPTKT